MSYICLKKKIDSNSENVNYFFLIKIEIEEHFLRSSSSYNSTKDIYYASNYFLKITNPVKNINELDSNKYYISFDNKEKIFGFRTSDTDSLFIKILEFDRKTGFYNDDCPELKKKIFTLMIDNGFIELLNFTDD
jgi:hypothetical protein